MSKFTGITNMYTIYEQQKKKLQALGLAPQEYEKAVRELAELFEV